jgi:hypothetical protein
VWWSLEQWQRVAPPGIEFGNALGSLDLRITVGALMVVATSPPEHLAKTLILFIT